VVTEFREELGRAFPATTIDAAGAFDERGGTYPDADEYESQIAGKTWLQLDQEYIARRSDALSFLSTDQLIAVLPAYLDLLLALGPLSPVPETLLPLLTRPSSDQSSAGKRFGDLSRRLTEPQRHAVTAALRRFAADHPRYAEPAQRALESFWNTIESEGGGR